MPTYVCFISAHQSQIDNVWDTKHWSAMLLSPGIHVPGSGRLMRTEISDIVFVRAEIFIFLSKSGPRD